MLKNWGFTIYIYTHEKRKATAYIVLENSHHVVTNGPKVAIHSGGLSICKGQWDQTHQKYSVMHRSKGGCGSANFVYIPSLKTW